MLDDPGVHCGFWDLANRPLTGEPGAYELYRSRPDLRAAFPAVGPELVAWARTHGVREHPQLGELLYASSERAGAGSFV